MRILSLLCIIFVLGSCENRQKKDASQNNLGLDSHIHYAKGFTINHFDTYSELTINNPWPGSEVSYHYLLKKDTTTLGIEARFDAVVQVPLKTIVVTSTTHIPSLEMLGVASKLVGFPNLDYISSAKTRARINEGTIAELGKNEDLNTEILIDLAPDAVVTFAVEGANKTIPTIEKSGIPVLYNGDWTETHPLGKAEWLKFLGYFLIKSKRPTCFSTQSFHNTMKPNT